MAVALRDLGRAVDLGNLAALSQTRRISAEAHGAAEIAVGGARLQLVAFEPLGQKPDDWLGRRAELRRVGLLDPGERARRLDHRHLHPETDAEIRDLALAGVAGGANLSFSAALAETARDQDSVDAFEKR